MPNALAPELSAASFASTSSGRASSGRPSSTAISASVSSPAATPGRKRSLRLSSTDSSSRAEPVLAAALLVPGEPEVTDRVRLEEEIPVRLRPVVGALEVGQRRVVVVPDDLMDDPDPEASPALEPLVSGLARQLERALEVLELAWILGAPLGEEGRMEDAPSFLEEPRFGPHQFDARRGSGLGRAREERLFVEKVGPLERVGRELERFAPAARTAQLPRLGGHRHADSAGFGRLWDWIASLRCRPDLRRQQLSR